MQSQFLWFIEYLILLWFAEFCIDISSPVPVVEITQTAFCNAKCMLPFQKMWLLHLLLSMFFRNHPARLQTTKCSSSKCREIEVYQKSSHSTVLHTPSKHEFMNWSMKILKIWDSSSRMNSPHVETSNATILPFPLARGNGRIPWNPGIFIMSCDECRPWVLSVAPKRVRSLIKY